MNIIENTWNFSFRAGKVIGNKLFDSNDIVEGYKFQ
jgi:hypothetical protein